MSQLINPTGPEANNQRAAAFEDEVVEWMGALGWDVRCRNVDLYAREGGQSKGVDVLAAYADPQRGQSFGLLGESKIRHPLEPGKTQHETAALAEKLARLSATIAKLDLTSDLTAMRTGYVVYDARPFKPDTLRTALSTLQLVGRTRSEWPREVWALGPDTLVGMTDAFGRCDPHEFYWPPYGRSSGRWSSAAPPHQLAAGMLAWRDADSKVCLWLRDGLEHDDDLAALSPIVWEWQIDVSVIVGSSVSRDWWRTQTTRWEQEVKRAHNRRVGLLPDAIDVRELSWDSMTPWHDRWGAQTA